MDAPKSAELSRRRLFVGAGSAGALAVAAVAVPLTKPTVVEAPKPAPEDGGGYQLTQHVLDYYQTTRV
jgi:hypothetical protein